MKLTSMQKLRDKIFSVYGRKNADGVLVDISKLNPTSIADKHLIGSFLVRENMRLGRQNSLFQFNDPTTMLAVATVKSISDRTVHKQLVVLSSVGFAILIDIPQDAAIDDKACVQFCISFIQELLLRGAFTDTFVKAIFPIEVKNSSLHFKLEYLRTSIKFSTPDYASGGYFVEYQIFLPLESNGYDINPRRRRFAGLVAGCFETEKDKNKIYHALCESDSVTAYVFIPWNSQSSVQFGICNPFAENNASARVMLGTFSQEKVSRANLSVVDLLYTDYHGQVYPYGNVAARLIEAKLDKLTVYSPDAK